VTRPTPPDRARRTGNPGHRALRVLDGAGLDLGRLGNAPATLGPSGLAAWAILARCAWVTALDAPLAVMFAEGLDLRARLRDDLAASPYTTGSAGQLRAHPAGALLAAQERQLERWARMLLLSPDDRARLGIAGAKARSRLDDLRSQAAARKEF